MNPLWNAALKGAGVSAIIAVLMGGIAYTARGDRYGIEQFLLTLTGLTLTGAVAGAVAVQTQDNSYERGWNEALSSLNQRIKEAENAALPPAAKPSLIVKDGKVQKPNQEPVA